MADEKIEKVLPKANCARFWKSLLFHNTALLPISTVVIIKATIKHLEEVKVNNKGEGEWKG